MSFFTDAAKVAAVAAGAYYGYGALTAADAAAATTTAAAAASNSTALAAAGITGGATLAGSLMTNQANTANAYAQMAFSAQQAGSIYQRGAADLAAAGINPVIAYGSPASMASFNVPNLQPSLSLAANAATSAYDSVASGHQKLADAAKTSAQTAAGGNEPALVPSQVQANSAHAVHETSSALLKNEQAAVERIRQDLVKSEVTYKQAQTFLTKAEADLTKARENGQIAETEFVKKNTDLLRQKHILNSPDVNNVLNHADASAFGAWLRSWSPLTGIVNSVK